MISIDTTHPALPGHFPGNPIVPAVVLVDYMLDAIAARHPPVKVTAIARLRFLRVLRPGELFTLECDRSRRGRLRVRCLAGTEPVADGSFEVAG